MSRAWLLMSWFLRSPVHQHTWNWLWLHGLVSCFRRGGMATNAGVLISKVRYFPYSTYMAFCVLFVTVILSLSNTFTNICHIASLDLSNCINIPCAGEITFKNVGKLTSSQPHQSAYCGHIPLQWRHNDQDNVSNHQPHGCLLNRLYRRRSKKTSKLRVTGLCVGNSPGPVNSPHKRPVTRKMFPFDDVIMRNMYTRHTNKAIWLGTFVHISVTKWCIMG